MKVNAGVDYCTVHNGIRNEDEAACDFAKHDLDDPALKLDDLDAEDQREPRECVLRPMFYESEESDPTWVEFREWPGGPFGVFIEAPPESTSNVGHTWVPNPHGGHWEICTDEGCGWWRLGPFEFVGEANA
jgi:hypothetical protein